MSKIPMVGRNMPVKSPTLGETSKVKIPTPPHLPPWGFTMIGALLHSIVGWHTLTESVPPASECSILTQWHIFRLLKRNS